jgi:Protein of unknown function (DUF3352)
MPESKSKFLIPAIGAAAVAVGSIAAYMYFLKGPSGDSSGAIGSARVVPDDALIATYITTDAQAWSKLEQFGTPEAQKVISNSLEAFNKQTLTDGNFSYEKDIKPWIGGVMVAVLPSSPVKPTQAIPPQTNPQTTPPITIPQGSQEPNVLMVVGIKDKVSALNLANRLKSQKDVKTQEIDYKGEKITETKGQGKPTYSAIVNNNNYLVFSQDKRTIEQAIDTVKGEPSFASKQGASEILSKGVDVQNAVAQIYVPDYAGMFEQLIKSNPQATQIPPQTLDQLKQVKSMTAGVGIDNDGVRMKAIANLDPQLSKKYKYEPSSAKIISQFPADTLALVSGQGISRWWQAVADQSKDYPELSQALQQARAQLQGVSIDLDKDIFGWMDGEFGMAAIPSNQGVLASLGFGGAFIFNTSDRKTAEATFTKIDNLMKTQNVNVQARKVGDKNITEWQIPNQGGILAHGWLDQNTVFVALGGPIADVIANKGATTLDNSNSFKTITGSLQKPNGGYVYIDMEKTMSIVNKFASAAQPIPSDTTAILNSIRGIGVTATSNNDSTTQMEMLLSLKPKSGN